MIEIHKALSQTLDFLFFFVKQLFKYKTEDDKMRVLFVISCLLTVVLCFGISHYDPRIPVLVMLLPAMFGALVSAVVLMVVLLSLIHI